MTLEFGTVGAPPNAAPAPSGGFLGYLRRHWRGELTLPQSYWVNGVLIGIPFNLYFRILGAVFEAQPPESLPLVAWSVFIPFLLLQPLLIWQGVGIWRSAGRRIDEGKPGWAWVARIVVIGNLALFAYSAAIYGKLAYSLSLAYFDQQNAHFEATIDRDIVVFSGEITPVSADRLQTLLSSKDVNRLVIRQSAGGYVLPALRIVRVIADRKLTVVALRECASICTVLLAAGAKRFVSPFAVIRLHTGSMVGTNDKAEHWSEAEAWYVRAGMGSGLLNKIHAHSGPYDFYEPTLSEITANGLATHIFDSQHQMYVPARMWCEQNPVDCSRTGRENLRAASMDKH